MFMSTARTEQSWAECALCWPLLELQLSESLASENYVCGARLAVAWRLEVWGGVERSLIFCSSEFSFVRLLVLYGRRPFLPLSQSVDQIEAAGWERRAPLVWLEVCGRLGGGEPGWEG